MSDGLSEPPGLALPRPARTNPHLDAARRYALDWAGQVGMLDDPAIWTAGDLGDHDYGLLAAATHPDCEPERLTLITAWYAWAFFVGDHFRVRYGRGVDLAGAKAYLDRLQGFTPADGSAPVVEASHPVERGLADLWPRTAHPMPRRLRDRFVTGTRNLLLQSLWELTNSRDGRVPDPVDYVRTRRRMGGAAWSAALVEFAVAGPGVPVRIEGAAPLRTLRDSFVDAAHLRNDMFSHRRTAGRVDGTVDVNNCVTVLERFLRLRPAAAVRRVGDIVTARLRQFEQTALTELPALLAEEGITETEQAAVMSYVDGLRDWQSGAHAWHAVTGRYRVTLPAQPKPPGRTPDRPEVAATPGYPFRLPEFAVPWTAVPSRYLGSARRLARDWAQRMGMLESVRGIWTPERFDALELALLAALTHPDVSPERPHIATLWDVWSFALDAPAQDGLDAFVRGLEQWLAGDLAWYFQTRRYAEPPSARTAPLVRTIPAPSHLPRHRGHA